MVHIWRLLWNNRKWYIYIKSNNYDRLGTYLINIHSLLLSQQKEMEEIIDKTYEEIKSTKQENEKIEAIS